MKLAKLTQKDDLVQIRCKVNGDAYTGTVEPRTLLVYFLRDVLNLTGTHVGCDTGHCGACTVIMDGKTVKSCMVLAVQAEGASILTVEGLAKGENLHPIQEAFWENHGRTAVRLLYPRNVDVEPLPLAEESQPDRRGDSQGYRRESL